MKKKWKILVIDDDAAIRRSFEKFLHSEGHAVFTAEDGHSGWDQIVTHCPDVVILDLTMPRMGGLELLEKMRQQLGATMPLVITVTAYGDLSAAVKATQLGSYDFLTKPIPLEKLRLTLQRSFEKILLRETVVFCENALPPSTETIVGRSPVMVEIYKQIATLATNRATVLITGESGTGKEVVARAIHETSAGKNAPWVAVNCAALPANLMEAELMGHTKGAFTGADHPSEGKLGIVGNGTLLLDEISEIPLELQAKLLRLLQEREYFPVGATTPRAFTGRIIATTNRDLSAAVRAGSFREDLFYRLDVVHIHLPPLREHRDDIDLLAPHFIRKINAVMHTSIEGITYEGLSFLKSHQWPGNVRELEHVITKAAITSKDRIITRDMLEAALNSSVGERDSECPPSSKDGSSLLTLREVEKRHIASVFAACGFHKGKTAAVLGITRPTLDKKLEEYGIRKENDV